MEEADYGKPLLNHQYRKRAERHADAITQNVFFICTTLIFLLGDRMD